MVEVDGVVLTIGTDKAAEGTSPSEEASQGGVDTHTQRDAAKNDERNCHRERSLMWSVMLVGFLVLGSPEDSIVETEHVEGCHGGNACHDPTHHRTVLEAGCDDLILRAEA